jgi:hypothetical protein
MKKDKEKEKEHMLLQNKKRYSIIKKKGKFLRVFKN